MNPTGLRITLWGKHSHDIPTRPSQWRKEGDVWVVKLTDRQAKQIASLLPPAHTARLFPRAVVDGQEYPAEIDDRQPVRGGGYIPRITYWRQNGWVGTKWIG